MQPQFASRSADPNVLTHQDGRPMPRGPIGLLKWGIRSGVQALGDRGGQGAHTEGMDQATQGMSQMQMGGPGRGYEYGGPGYGAPGYGDPYGGGGGPGNPLSRREGKRARRSMKREGKHARRAMKWEDKHARKAYRRQQGPRGPIGYVKKAMQPNVLYLMVVTMPPPEEMQRAYDALELKEEVVVDEKPAQSA